MALTTTPPVVPTARDVRALRRTFARRHAYRGNRAGTILLLLLTVYVTGGASWWIATRSFVITDSALLDPGQGWPATWGWALFVLALAGGLATTRAFGPVTASPEEAIWLLSTPVERASLLRPRLIGPLVAGAAIGLIAGRLAAFVAATTSWAPMTVLGAAAGSGVVGIGVLAQGGLLLRRVLPVLQWGVVGLGFGVSLAAMFGVVFPVVTTWSPVAVVAAAAGALAILAILGCGRLSRAEVDFGADLAVGTRASLIALDAAGLVGILDARAWRRIGSVRSERLAGGRIRAMIHSDLLRHRRRPSTVVIAAIVVGAVWIAATIGTPILVALAQFGALFVVAMVFSTGLRDLCGDNALRVVLGAGDRALRLPLLVVPLIAVTVSAALTAPTLGLWVPALLISCVGALLAAYRMRTRAAISYDGLILVTGYGQVPVDLIRQLLRGPDVLLVAAVLLILVI
ncbi:DUF6297 family protein [Nocardia suismassiliense]|uniref:DUF6297 family protein n=1 Tax=Nocardia suismassiliense TaxID=2077092 RepID=A0ABW6R7M2_9NOCA